VNATLPGTRPSMPPAASAPLRLGNLVLSTTRFDLEVAHRYVDLTFGEFELMRLFFSHPNRILPYHFITSTLFHSTERRAVRRLAVLVCRVRTKLAGSKPYVLTTVRGRGYGLVSSEMTQGPRA